MNRLAFTCLLCLGLLGVDATGHAHEMGTSALIVHESASGTGQFVFKRTVGSDDKIPPIDFQFAPACELRDVSTEWEGNTELIQRGNFFAAAHWPRMKLLQTDLPGSHPTLSFLPAHSKVSVFTQC